MQQSYKNVIWYLVDSSTDQKHLDNITNFCKTHPQVNLLRIFPNDIHSPVASTLNILFTKIKDLDFDYFLRIDMGTVLNKEYIINNLLLFNYYIDSNIGAIAGQPTPNTICSSTIFSAFFSWCFNLNIFTNVYGRMVANDTGFEFGCGAPMFRKSALASLNYQIPLYVAEDQNNPLCLLSKKWNVLKNYCNYVSCTACIDFTNFKKMRSRNIISTIEILPSYRKYPIYKSDAIYGYFFKNIGVEVNMPFFTVIALFLPIFSLILGYQNDFLNSLPMFLSLGQIILNFGIPFLYMFKKGILFYLKHILSIMFIFPALAFINFEG
jgi:hypothetical protein